MQKLILASRSPGRLYLLDKIGVKPDAIMPADIDEIEFKNEKPQEAAYRLAKSKAEHISKQIDNGYIIAADSIVSLGNKILPKPVNEELWRLCLNSISGKRHHIHSGVTVVKVVDGSIAEIASKVVESSVKFKRLTDQDISWYIKTGEGLNKAGGYSIQGKGEVFVRSIHGSYSNIVGLPLYEVRNMLGSLGYNLG